MPRPGQLAKAQLIEMWPDSEGELDERGKDGGDPKKVTVQFNPHTLTLALSNQAAGGDQAGGSSTQFVGTGTTKLNLELWFDVQLPLPEGTADPRGDVRNLTKDVAYFMEPQKVKREGAEGLLPPAVKFLWGTFLFKGLVDSLNETLEHFSEDGRPLRAGVTLSLSKQDLAFEFGEAGKGPKGAAPPPLPGGGGPAGTSPMESAREGESLQDLTARTGGGDWKKVGMANGIENPRRLPPGALIDPGATPRQPPVPPGSAPRLPR